MAKEPNHFVYEDDEFGTEGIEIIPPPEDPIAELDAEIARVDAILKAAGEGVDVADAVLPLYISRKVLNAEEVLTWAREQGFKNLLDADELHVTQAYSRQPLEWFDVDQSWEEKLEIDAGGPRAIEMFGSAVVLRFASRSLQWRFEDLQKLGASWDYAEYKPHMTLSYAGSIPPGAVPYQGRLELGPEIFEEVDDPSFFADGFNADQPRDKDGRWTSSGGGAAFLEGSASINMFGQPSEKGIFVALPKGLKQLEEDSELSTRMYREAKDSEAWKGRDLTEFQPTLENLVATQPVLKRSTMEELINNYDPKKSTRTIQPGSVYKTPSGKFVIFDGHHRMIAAALEGRPVAAIVYHGKEELDG